MTGPELDRIWLQERIGPDMDRTWCAEQIDDDDTEYIRRDRDALAALPEVQALIRQAVEAERKAWQSMSMVDFANQNTTQSIAAIRKRGEGQP